MSLQTRRSALFGAAASFIARPGLAQPVKAERIRVLKSWRLLQLMAGADVLKAYPVALGRHPRGPKRRMSDGRTPEGVYAIDWRTKRSAFHRALHITYPNTDDLSHAHAAKINPGGDIFIHGMPVRYGHFDPVRFFVDWTDGCIAVGNIAIDEIWNATDDGTPVEIMP